MNKVIMVLLPLLLAGCLSAPPAPEDRFYRLQPVPPVQAVKQSRLTGGLVIDDVSADPLHSGRAILYCEQDRPLQLRRYHYEFWLDQPPRLVQRTLTTWLRASGIADQLLDPQSREAAWRLRARVLKFEEVRAADRRAQVDVALRVSLFSADAKRTVWTRDYGRQEPVEGTTMYAVAQAMQAALAALYAQVQADLALSAL